MNKIVKGNIQKYSLCKLAQFVSFFADELKKQIGKIKSSMIRAAKKLDFVEAARLRDEMYAVKKMLQAKED